ncbi:DUF4326 domain-containing protein [Sulfitobacter sp. R18_1]|uniref:DUF4326 domain-containing protein n=1 Tax=Sulfitobacter sp. R18_1 TaxID=2821104 RepID=UPI001ADA8E56|nr:DUF4326 domain-containing protein [Sulfitobacter sp. R18_1]MBO9427955.1 DUF4326 domain-containing protein [Sulfitobacter sp. R18_1]
MSAQLLDFSQKARAVHLKRHEYDVRIDRRTRWGNPEPMANQSDRERDRVIAVYRDYLWDQIKKGKVTLEDLAALHGKRLGCHCAPKACHGDVLANAAQWAYAKLYLGAA